MISLLFTLMLGCTETTDQSAAVGVAVANPPAAQGNEADADSSMAATDTVAKWDGGTLTYEAGTAAAAGQLKQMKAEYLSNKYSAEKASIEQAVIEKLLDAEAKKGGYKTTEDLLKVEIEDKITPPAETEVTTMYEQFKARLQGMPQAEALGMVRTQLLRQKQAERFQVYIEELKSTYNLTITLPYPEVPRAEISADDDPFLGPDNAPVTIIQFAEFQCPYCSRGNQVMEEVRKAYGDKVKIVYRDFPLDFHDRAIPAAVAANCAEKQGKFWEIHSILMSNQQKLQDEDLLSAAKQVGVADIAAWQSCLKDPEQAKEVMKDQQDGAKAGVTGTPAFFVNGIFLNGAQPFEEFKSIIDRELEG